MSDQATAIRKLPIWRTAKAAYLVILRNRGLAVKLAIIPIILLIIQDIVWTYFWGGMTQDQMTATMKENVGLAALVIVVDSVFYLSTIPMITAWHRMVILGRADPESRVRYSIKTPEWLYLRKAILFGLWYLLAYLLGALIVGVVGAFFTSLVPPANERFAIIVMKVLTGSVLFAVILRISLVFPAAAVGKTIGFGDSWLESEGNTWRLFAAVCLGFIPSVIIPFVLNGMIFGYWFFNAEGTIMPAMPEQMVMSVINIPFWLIGLCVGVSVWSWAYRYLYQGYPITLPGEA